MSERLRDLLSSGYYALDCCNTCIAYSTELSVYQTLDKCLDLSPRIVFLPFEHISDHLAEHLIQDLYYDFYLDLIII